MELFSVVPDSHLSGLERSEFPQLNRDAVIYFDSASTALKPNNVIRSVHRTYHGISNVGRSGHRNAERVTSEFEQSREIIASFMNCSSSELIFSLNCTDSINLICNGLQLSKKDRIIISSLEHHSNLLPWLKVARVEFVDVNADGIIDLEHLDKLLMTPAKLVSICYVSNVTGNIQPVEKICEIARKHGVISLVDAAQAMGHISVDVRKIGCDVLAFSIHKAFGPSGVGGLFIRETVQKQIINFRVGGGMVDRVTAVGASYRSGPAKFEAGTPNIEGVIGAAAAFEFINSVGQERIEQHNRYLDTYLRSAIAGLDMIKLPFGFAPCRIPIVSMVFQGDVDINWVSTVLSDSYDIAVNSGYQCNQLLYNQYSLKGGLRVSLHMYNTIGEIDSLISALSDILY